MSTTVGSVLTGCAVWDGVADATAPGWAVHVRADGTLGAVGPEAEVLAAAPDADRVDLGGGVVVPGLLNMHVHLGLALPGAMQDAARGAGEATQTLLMTGNAAQTLRAGVTTVRLVGETGFTDMALRAAVRAGHVPGPRIFTAGHALCCTGGHGHDADAMEADGADGFRRATRVQLRAGADLIKVCISGGIAGLHETIDSPQMTDEEMAAVISTAHDWGRKVTAHAGPTPVVRRAVELGLDCVEHGYELDAEVCALMAERGVAYVPTITVSRCEEFFRANGVPQWMIDRALGAGPRHWESLQHAIAAGVTIMMGTDMPPQAEYDGTTATVREMEFMVDAGMSPLQVMRSATGVPADWLGGEDVLGRLVPGAVADLLVLDADPVADVSALRGLHAVVQGGRTVRDDRGLLTALGRP
ncbi:metal-dependent hydrolase family protein [Cellulomonas shaoxiangyii]|uniref:Amidohydrolase family protein n=1 Tax=Cellulomonas shaoxiangyii TaxID=2566013 RepID=A0A4P7SHS9_9CELL|nr:amidohydrolase family protein [Cellulomonas shaoxiangyii]QCB92686.1 amidohydrolase family protein [Cellulomonas shaoxiangyii]TGY83417.1 amidohydrolase family protein [Cellulomonas shaoxiangyii]